MKKPIITIILMKKKLVISTTSGGELMEISGSWIAIKNISIVLEMVRNIGKDN